MMLTEELLEIAVQNFNTAKRRSTPLITVQREALISQTASLLVIARALNEIVNITSGGFETGWIRVGKEDIEE